MASKEKIHKDIKIIEKVTKKPIIKKGGSGTIFIQLKTLGLDKLLSKKRLGGEMLKNPKKADLDKDGKLSSYEKKRGKAIEANMKAKKGKMMYANKGKIALIKKLSGMQISDAEAEKIKKMSTQDIRDKLREKKMVKAKKGVMAKEDDISKYVRKFKTETKPKGAKRISDVVRQKSIGGEMRGFGAARTSGTGLQDESLPVGKSLDYYKDLM